MECPEQMPMLLRAFRTQPKPPGPRLISQSALLGKVANSAEVPLGNGKVVENRNGRFNNQGARLTGFARAVYFQQQQRLAVNGIRPKQEDYAETVRTLQIFCFRGKWWN